MTVLYRMNTLPLRKITPGRTGRPSDLVARLCCLFVVALTLSGAPALAQSSTDASEAVVAKVDPGVTTIGIRKKTDIQFRKLSLSQGLSQTRVGQILQDDEGYIWLGSQHGVNRYDGYSFQVFKHDRDDPGSLSGVYIYSMFKDRAGTVWIGSDQFLDAFDRKTGKFRHYVIDTTTPTILHISQDRKGFLWLSTAQGLYRLEPETGAVKRFGQIKGNDHGLSTDDVKSTGEDREGTFWVATGNGLEAFDPETGQVHLRIPLHVEAREFRFLEDSHGLFWIFYGTGNGLALYDKATNTLKHISFGSSATDDSLSGIYNVIEAKDGDLWITTMGAGLLRFNHDEFAFDQYVNDPTDPQSLAENRVIEVFEDRQGNIWTGLHASPPNVFSRNRLPFQRVWPYPGHVNKLGEMMVNTVFEDRDGDVWLGVGGALNKVDRTGALSVIDLSGQNKSIEILSIVQDPEGMLWIGTIGAGLYSYDPKSEKIENYRYDKNRANWLTSDVITRIYVEPTGVLWMSTWNGLNRFDPKARSFAAYRADSTSNRAFFSIVPDDKGNLWVGSLVGFVKFEKATGQFTEYKHDPNNRSSLSNNTVNNIFRDREGTFWLATHNGLNRFNPETGDFKAYFDKDGLAGSAISCVLQDKNGELWMSTNHGVSKLDPKTERFENFTTVDGLPGDDMGGWHACAKGANDRLYFGGFPGAAVADPSFVEPDTAGISVAFTDIKIADQSVLYPKGSQNSYSLAHDQSLAVTFSALDFSNPAGTRYRYKVEGLDKDWHEAASSQRTLNYAALPAGEFALEVQAASERGDWRPGSAKLAFVVSPPWWQTWWFYAAVAAALVAVMTLMYRLRLRQLASIYNLRLEERIGERTRVARDLHDTLLQSFQGLTYRLEAIRNLLPGHPEEAAEMLDVVLTKSDDAIIEGRETIQSLRDPTRVTADLVVAIRSDSEELALLQTGGNADFTLDIDGPVIVFPPNVRHEIRQIARELLRNAFAHSAASKIECHLSFGHGLLTMTIKDNGRGMRLDRDGNPIAVPGHFGLSGVRERAQKLDGEIDITSAEGLGTKVVLTVTTEKAELASIAKKFADIE